MSVTIRPVRPHDATAIRGVLTAAFDDGGRAAALAEALRARPDRGTALVAVDEHGDVVGIVQLSVSWLDAPDDLVDVLVLSPLGVAPSHRSRGVGGSLLEAAAEQARN